jgi:DNA gyrase inhibitor GyrI
MRVACLSVKDEHPELEALTRLIACGEKRGLLEGYRLFGYDNCEPHPNHVYTAVLTVGPDVTGDGDVVVTDLEGGLYAMTSATGVSEIGESYARLAEWVAANDRELDQKHPFFELEEHLTPLDTPPDEFRIDLHVRLVE